MDKRIEALLKSMEIELNGITLYRNAANYTDDEQAEKVFNFLANEEIKHYKALRRIYEGLLNGKTVDVDLVSELPPFGRIFSDEFKQKLEGKNYEFSAISTGLLLEKNSVDFYREQKEISIDENLKKLYSELEKWEQEHYNMLLNEYNDLKEAFWEANKFSPF